MLLQELYKIRYLLVLELGLLALISLTFYLAALITLSLIILFVLVYYAFNYPIIAIHVLLFSMLIDALMPLKYYSSNHSLLFVEFFFAVFFVLGSFIFLFNLDKEIKVPLLILLWIPFLAWTLPIGLIVAEQKLKILVYWKIYLAGFFSLSLTYYSIKKAKQLESVIIGIIIWGSVLSLIELKILLDLGGFTSGIIGLFFKKNLLDVGWGRSNYLATFFVVIIPISISYLFYVNSKKSKFLIAFALLLMSFAIILTLSRGGILALLAALIILFSRIIKRRTFIPFIILFLLLMVIVLINPLTYVLIDRISSLDTSGTYFSRINFYIDVWNTFLKHPIMGVGFGNLGNYAKFAFAPDMPASAHNIILGMLGETGAVGAAFFLFLLGLLVSRIYSGFKLERDHSIKILRWGFFASIIGGIIHSMMEPTLEGLQFSIVFWMLIGVYLNLDLLNKNKLKINSNIS